MIVRDRDNDSFLQHAVSQQPEDLMDLAAQSNIYIIEKNLQGYDAEEGDTISPSMAPT